MHTDPARANRFPRKAVPPPPDAPARATAALPPKASSTAIQARRLSFFLRISAEARATNRTSVSTSTTAAAMEVQRRDSK